MRWFGKPLPAVGQTPADPVHAENKWRLLRYRRATPPAFRTPVLLVPSLINRHYVLDLMPGKSLVEFLLAKGHDVFVIDWGTPGPEDRHLGFDEICDRYLGRAVRVAARHGGRGQAHVLGYCMGGTLAAVEVALHPETAASFVGLAAPIKFGDAGLLSTWTRTRSFDVGALVEGLGNVPWQLMQSAFHLLRPTLTLSKLVTLLDKHADDEFVDGFLALETWGSDNVSLPGGFYRKYIEDVYRADALARGELHVSGQRVDLRRITCPTLAVTFEHDTIVPAESAAPLVDLVGAPDRQRLHLPGGHVGAVVSRKAARGVWLALHEFWRDRDGAAAEAPAGRNGAHRPVVEKPDAPRVAPPARRPPRVR